jgi:hypothetical protein
MKTGLAHMQRKFGPRERVSRRSRVGRAVEAVARAYASPADARRRDGGAAFAGAQSLRTVRIVRSSPRQTRMKLPSNVRNRLASDSRFMKIS